MAISNPPNLIEATERFRRHTSGSLANYGGGPHDNDNGGAGPPGGDDMLERVAKLEVQFEHIDARLDRIEDKMLTSWDVAKVQAGIIVFAITLIMLGPRLLALLPAATP